MRAFFAIELAHPVRAELVALQQRICSPGVKCLKPEQLHLTLKFLGEVAAAHLPAIQEQVRQAAATVREFSVTIQGAGCFPPRGRANIVWAGVQCEGGALADCFSKLEHVLCGLGFAKENRTFHPHITIARVKDDRSKGKLREAAAAESYPPLLQPVAELTLFESKLQPSGAEYRAVERFPFLGA